MISAVHQPHYLPWLGYFHKIENCDVFVFLDDVQYKKREFQNRNKIRTKDGSIWLTVPVETKGKYFQKIGEVGINGAANWANEHWKAIELNYGGALFFKEYSARIREIYEKKWNFLKDLNVEAINVFADILGIKKKMLFSSDMKIESVKTQRIVDICKKLGADTYLSGAGGREYMEEGLFADNGIKLIYQEFKHPVYKQAFKGFEPYMSAIDLIFNEGPKSRNVLISNTR